MNFEAELAKFQPSLEVDRAEDAIYNNNTMDVTDLLHSIIQDKGKKEKANTVDTKVSDKTSEKDNHNKEYSTEIKKVSRKLKKGFEAADMHVDIII